MPNSFLSTVLFQTIHFSISTQFKCQKHFYFKLFSLVNKVKWFKVLLCITKNSIKHQSFIHTQLNVKTVLFQTIQFNVITHFSSIWPIDRTLLGATTSSQCGPGSDGNKRVLCVPQHSSITEASPSDCLVSYPVQSFWECPPPLQKCCRCTLQPQPTWPAYEKNEVILSVYICTYVCACACVLITTIILLHLDSLGNTRKLSPRCLSTQNKGPWTLQQTSLFPAHKNQVEFDKSLWCEDFKLNTIMKPISEFREQFKPKQIRFFVNHQSDFCFDSQLKTHSIFFFFFFFSHKYYENHPASEDNYFGVQETDIFVLNQRLFFRLQSSRSFPKQHPC